MTTVVALAAFSACGGGSDPPAPSTPSTPAATAAATASATFSGALVNGPFNGPFNGASVCAYITPLTTFALNAARGSGASTLDTTAFNQAVVAVLNALGIAAGIRILHTAPAVTGAFNVYGAGLLNSSRRVAAGLPLAQTLSTTQPAMWPTT